MPAETENRRSGQKGTAPTQMMKAVAGMEKWKLNVMFVVGLTGVSALMYWFVFADRGHEHSMSEFIVGGIMFGVSAFFAFPLGITRLADKYMPDKWRKERRT